MDEQQWRPTDAELSGSGPMPEQKLCPVCHSRPVRTATGTCFYEVCTSLGALREAIQAGKRSEFETGPHSPLRELIGGEYTISRPRRIDGLDGKAA